MAQATPTLSKRKEPVSSKIFNIINITILIIISLLCLLPFINIIAKNKEKREQALKDFTTHLRLSSDFRASMVATETGSVGKGYTEDNFTEAAFKEVIHSVKLMVADAEKFGTTVAIEAGINHPLHTAQLCKRMIDEVDSPNLKLIMDCANLIRLENHNRQEEVIKEALDLLGDHIVAMHIKDYIIEEGKVIIVPVGTGEMDYHQIMHYIKYTKPYLFVSLEATREPDLDASIKLIKEIYEKI